MAWRPRMPTAGVAANVLVTLRPAPFLGPPAAVGLASTLQRGGQRGDHDAMRDRAVTDAFEPGSTFKSFLVAAALEEEGHLDDDRALRRERGPGHARRADHPPGDHKPYGWLGVGKVLQCPRATSGRPRSGCCSAARRLARYLHDFGFGQRTDASAAARRGAGKSAPAPVRTWPRPRPPSGKASRPPPCSAPAGLCVALANGAATSCGLIWSPRSRRPTGPSLAQGPNTGRARSARWCRRTPPIR